MTGPYECFACGKMTRGSTQAKRVAFLLDDAGAMVYVGPDCHRRIQRSGSEGYTPPKGGPRLFFSQSARQQYLKQEPNEHKN